MDEEITGPVTRVGSDGRVHSGSLWVRMWPPEISEETDECWILAQAVAASLATRNTVPRPVSLAFTCGQSPWKWILFFSADFGQAEQLFDANPCLAWLAMSGAPREGRSVPGYLAHYGRLLQLAGASHYQLLQALYINPPKSHLRLLYKCVPACANDLCTGVISLVSMRKPAFQWASPMLHGLQRITPDTISTVRLGREWVGWSLMEATQSSVDYEVTWAIQAARTLWNSLCPGLPYPYRNLNCTQLQHAIRKLQLRDERILFPPPPIPGIQGLLHPLDTPRKLYDEGEGMRNCAYSLRDRVLEGIMYLYHYEVGPHTVAIIRHAPDKLWMLFDMRNLDNKHPEPPGAVEDIMQWLSVGQGVASSCDLNGLLEREDGGFELGI